MKTIAITVTPTGQTTIETTGFSGSRCQEASRFIEQALGHSTQEQLKPEFHQTVSAGQTQQQRE